MKQCIVSVPAEIPAVNKGMFITDVTASGFTCDSKKK